MRSIKSIALCSIAAALLVACGGGGNGNQSPRVTYSSVVNFGDSLSDAGTYKAGVMANVTNGAAAGMFTVNGVAGAVGAQPVPTYTWAQLIGAAAVGTPTCAARSGGFGIVTSTVAGCTDYAQGGSRVTSWSGIGNNAGNTNNVGGALTQPVVTQISNYLADIANGGSFKGTELVTVAGGANDVFFQAALVGASAISPTTAGINMATAATEMVTYINTMITNGATRIVVVNIPDISQTPQGVAAGTSGQALYTALVNAFNSTLQTGLAGNPKVLFVDAFAENQRQFLNPTQYGLTSTKSTACNLNLPSNVLATTTTSFDGSSLVCNTSNLNAGDTSHYLFADNVHPTPYGHKLLSQYVTNALLTAGWL